MRSSLPKVLHPICGRPLLSWPVTAAREAGAARVAVIVSPGLDISAAVPEGTEMVIQEKADGTGGAVRVAAELIGSSETVVVLSGDHPLISAEIVAALLSAHQEAGAAATVMTTVLEEPGSYGRIVRDDRGELARIVEAKEPGDASAEELAIKEINTGTYAFAAAPLAEALARIGNDNAQGEYYLGDVLPLIRADGLTVAAHQTADRGVTLGVNNRVDLAVAEAAARERILERHMLAGVTIVDSSSTWVDADVVIGADVRLEPGTLLRGRTEVGEGSVIGPHTTLIDATLGRRVGAPHSYLVECDVLDGCTIGPFAHLRPGTRLRDGAKAGSFVEIKNSEVGERSKVPHLSYVGDATIGADSNLGAGAITANYDGSRKHRTVVGDHVRIGVDTMMVAPVDIGDRAYTGAGAVIRSDVPPGSLAVSAGAQRNIADYSERKAQPSEEEDDS